MAKRIDILKKSLEKKNIKLGLLFDKHFQSVKNANGQPLNDKRCGAATFKRWEKQENAIRRAKSEVEKTKNAIEFEQGRIDGVKKSINSFPQAVVDLIDKGVLIVWRKNPNTLFVRGVDKARIVFKDGELLHRYVSKITNKEQYAIFRDIFNKLKREK